MNWQPVANEPILTEHFTVPLQALETLAQIPVAPGGSWEPRQPIGIGSQSLALSRTPVTVRVPRMASQLSLNLSLPDVPVQVRSLNNPDQSMTMAGVNRRGSGLRTVLVNPLLPESLIPRDRSLIGDVFELSAGQPVNAILLWS